MRPSRHRILDQGGERNVQQSGGRLCSEPGVNRHDFDGSLVGRL